MRASKEANWHLALPRRYPDRKPKRLTRRQAVDMFGCGGWIQPGDQSTGTMKSMRPTNSSAACIYRWLRGVDLAIISREFRFGDWTPVTAIDCGHEGLPEAALENRESGRSIVTDTARLTRPPIHGAFRSLSSRSSDQARQGERWPGGKRHPQLTWTRTRRPAPRSGSAGGD